MRGLVTVSVLNWTVCHGAVSISQWILSSPGVRVLPRDWPAGEEKEGPSGLHKVGRWSERWGQGERVGAEETKVRGLVVEVENWRRWGRWWWL